MTEKYRMAQETFKDAPEEDADFLRKFAFICVLGFDVYLKKLMIEKMIDEFVLTGKNKRTEKKSRRGDQGEDRTGESE